MGSDFFLTTIGEQVTLQRGFDITKKEQMEGNVPVVSSGGISSFHNMAKVSSPGVVLGRKGSLGTVYYLDKDFWPHDTTLWVKDFKGNNPYYVYCFFKGMSDALKKMDVGAANPALNRNHVHPLQVYWPKRSLQDEIVSIASVFDKKITLNRQINHTLEQMAQALFQSWFVDFDPVFDNALDAGIPIPAALEPRAQRRRAVRSAPGFTPLPEDVRRLFPGAFVESPDPSVGLSGWVPEGWETHPLDQIANFQNGLALQKFRPNSEDDEFLPVLKIAHLRQGYTDGNEKAQIDIKESCRVYDGDMIFSWSGTLLIDIWTGGNAALNQHLYKVTSEKYPLSFFLHWTKHHLARFQHIAAAKAVTMGHIKKGDLSDSICLIPSGNLVEKFNNIVDRYISQSINVRIQNRTLEELRDTLLPKLISGEFQLDSPEVKQTQALVGEAG
ncbi:MAG: hypothetical protein CENE_02602 [Candidatus Celerinatantimonas neptuna]|nr:MAG: hypothetical protein CENE_02602 [Candidatus Celerinatantimonas neptuna]